MLRITGKRGTGKTTEILRLAEESGGIVLMPTRYMIDYAKDLMKTEGMDQSRVRFYTAREWFNLGLHGFNIKEEHIYIDELDACLRTLLPNLDAYSMRTEDETIREHKLNGKPMHKHSIKTFPEDIYQMNKLIEICSKNCIPARYEIEGDAYTILGMNSFFKKLKLIFILKKNKIKIVK